MNQTDPRTRAVLDRIIGDAKQGKIIPDNAEGAFESKVPFTKRVTQRISTLTPEQKISTGINFLISGMCAVGAFRQLSNSFTKDEHGERHIQPTQFGLGIVSALLALGTAYLGAQALRTGHSH